MPKKISKSCQKYSLPLHIQNISEIGIHIFINIRINGKLIRALIDTGASETVLDLQSLKKIKESNFIENETKALGVNATELEIFKIKIAKISISKLTIVDEIYTVMDLNNINNSYIELGYKPFYAIIGGDLLLKYNALIDYKLKRIILRI